MVQMPALNTPQFDWVKSRLPNHAQPVPPIYQPEVAGRAIVYAALHPGAASTGSARRRPRPSWRTRSPRRLLDRYLARTGFASQQTDQPEDPNRPCNLWEPSTGAGQDHGAHGAVRRPLHPRSAQLEAAEAAQAAGSKTAEAAQAAGAKTAELAESAGAAVTRAFGSLITVGRRRHQ